MVVLSCTLLILSVLYLVPPAEAQSEDPSDPIAALVATDPPAGWPTPEGLDAAAYLLVDADTGQPLVASRADDRRPVASTLKLLTAYSVITRVDLDEEVTVGDEIEVGGSGVGLEPGDTWTVEELLAALLPRSGNDAAEALAVHVGGDREAFLRLMEEDAAALGLGEISITAPSGLDDDTLLSARDLATISRAVLEFEELRDIVGQRVVTLPDSSPEENRNELIGDYPGATGLKTGFTTPAGFSLVASAEAGGRELVAVVLGADEDPARFEIATALLDHGFEHTLRTEVGTEVALHRAGGQQTFVVDPLELTVPEDLDARLDVRLPMRPPEGDLEVPLVVGDDTLLTLTAESELSLEPTDGEEAAIGRALVDGGYAALRSAAAAGTLG